MAHTFKEREFVVDQAIALEIFRTIEQDAKYPENKEKLLPIIEEMREKQIDTSRAYRVVSQVEGKDVVMYVPREYLIDLLKDDEGFDFIWKAVKQELEKLGDEERGCSFSSDVEFEDYKEME